MATITLSSILDMLKHLADQSYKDRNNAAKWEANIEEAGQPKRKAEVVSASIEPEGFEFVVKDGNDNIKLRAYPSLSSSKKLKVDVNGSLDADAAVIYKPVPSFSNPARFHLDFKRVTLSGEDVRINLAFPRG